MNPTKAIFVNVRNKVSLVSRYLMSLQLISSKTVAEVRSCVSLSYSDSASYQLIISNKK